MSFVTFSPYDALPEKVIFPQQVHGKKIVEIITGEENLEETDGIFSRNPDLLLGIKTADCAPIVFREGKKFGVLHAGWRGLVDGICEKMRAEFTEPEIVVGVLLPVFEIQRDFCFSQISEKFGEHFFTEQNGQIFFHFLEAICSVLPEAKWSGETTEHEKWASHRRGDATRNMTIVGGTNTSLFS